MDDLDANFFSLAILLREVKSWVACRDNRAAKQAHQGNQPGYGNATLVYASWYC
jgi:hypothetical protein